MRIVLQPSPVEGGFFKEPYDALIADLQAQGYEVVLAEPEETRSGVPDPRWIYDLTVLVGELAEHALAVGALMAILQKHLRGRIGRGSTRRGVIRLPNGETHVFDMPEE